MPDLAVFHPDTIRTAPAFLASAAVVIELLSPGEIPGAKLGFYRSHGVEEVLEVDVATGHARLLKRPDPEAGPAEPWANVPTSQIVPGLLIVDGAVEIGGERYR